MALALSGKIGLSIALAQTNALDLSTPTDSLSINKSRSITSGTGASQSDVMWHDQRTLTNGASESLDLHGGTLNGPFGAITLDKVKGFAIFNYSTENAIKIGAAAANQLAILSGTTDTLDLPAASATNQPSWIAMDFTTAAGLDVSTNDELKVDHGGSTTNTITYDIVVWGED